MIEYEKFKTTKIGKLAGVIRDRLWLQRKNALISILGEPGSGKSLSAVTLAKLVDDGFSLDFLVYTPEEFLRVLDEAERGNVVIFDEAGVGLPAREWQSLQNKLINYVLQTFRYQNICVIFTTPHISYIDKQVRHLFNYSAVANGYDTKRDAFLTRWYVRQNNPFADIPSYEPFALYEDGKKVELGDIYVPLPHDLIDEYEEKARKRKTDIRKDALKKIEAMKLGVKEGIDGRALRKIKNQTEAFFTLIKYVKEEMSLSNRKLAPILGTTPASLGQWIKEWDANEHPLQRLDDELLAE
jgi:hypothetical protein